MTKYVTSHVKTYNTAFRSNGKIYGQLMDDKRVAKPFKMVTVNDWMAEEKFQTAYIEWLKILNSLRWMAEQLKKNFERLAVNGWTAKEKWMNGNRKY